MRQQESEVTNKQFVLLKMPDKNSLILVYSMILVNNPIELVKSRIQTMNQMIINGQIKEKYQGIVDCCKKVKRNQGLRVFWRGNPIKLTKCLINQNINYFIKTHIRKKLSKSFLSNVFAGICGGFASSCLLYPLDFIRIFLSTTIGCHKSSIKKLLELIKNQGFLRLYKGFRNSLFCIAIYRGSCFGCYDTIKSKHQSLYFRWFSAYISSLLAISLIYPLQTARKNCIITMQCSNQMQILSKILREQGIKGLYRGSSLIPIQALVGATLLVYFDRKNQKDA